MTLITHLFRAEKEREGVEGREECVQNGRSVNTADDWEERESPEERRGTSGKGDYGEGKGIERKKKTEIRGQTMTRASD